MTKEILLLGKFWLWGDQLTLVVLYGTFLVFNFMVVYGTQWNCMVMHDSWWYCRVLCSTIGYLPTIQDLTKTLLVKYLLS